MERSDLEEDWEERVSSILDVVLSIPGRPALEDLRTFLEQKIHKAGISGTVEEMYRMGSR